MSERTPHCRTEMFEQNALSLKNGKGSAECRKCTCVLVGVKNETVYDAIQRCHPITSYNG